MTMSSFCWPRPCVGAAEHRRSDNAMPLALRLVERPTQSYRPSMLQWMRPGPPVRERAVEQHAANAWSRHMLMTNVERTVSPTSFKLLAAPAPTGPARSSRGTVPHRYF